MSTPNNANLYVGAGEVWFNRFDSSGNKTQWRHLGNVSKLEITPNVATIEKRSAMSGTRGVLKRVVTESTAEVALTLDEFDSENVALALLGATAAFSQTTGTATDTAISGTTKKGSALDTGKLKITVTNVKVGATVLVLGTDYSVDSDSGLIMILPGASGSVPDGSNITWSGSWPTFNSTQVQAFSNAIIQGALRFRSASDAVGPRYLVEVFILSITPDGALSLLSDQFGEIGLKGEALADSTKPLSNQFFQATVL